MVPFMRPPLQLVGDAGVPLLAVAHAAESAQPLVAPPPPAPPPQLLLLLLPLLPPLLPLPLLPPPLLLLLPLPLLLSLRAAPRALADSASPSPSPPPYPSSTDSARFVDRSPHGFRQAWCPCLGGRRRGHKAGSSRSCRGITSLRRGLRCVC